MRLKRQGRKWLPRVWYWSAAAAIGLVAALFARSAEEVQFVSARLTAVAPWLMLVIAPAGLAAVAWITMRFVPAATGSGIPQVLASLRNEGESQRHRLLALPIAAAKPLLTLLGLACGASVGREGPTVQIGAAIALWVGRRRRAAVQRALVLAGGAAGVAAAFNTPIAGIVFAFEELASSLEEKASGTLLLVVIIAAVVAIAVLGDQTYLGTTDANIESVGQWRAVLLCGVVGGGFGGLFSRFLYFGTRRARDYTQRFGLRVPLACGLGLAILGLVSGGAIYGSGYEQTRLALGHPEELSAAFPLLKLIATWLSYFSGIPGGIFSPSLAVGAGLGADLARLSELASPQAMTLLTMAAYFAGATRAPLTAAVIVAEMSLGQRMILPLMAASLLGGGAARIVWRDSLYRALMRDLLESGAAAAAHSETPATSVATGPVSGDDATPAEVPATAQTADASPGPPSGPPAAS
jgi:H+/Cl- antiporter ClcA